MPENSTSKSLLKRCKHNSTTRQLNAILFEKLVNSVTGLPYSKFESDLKAKFTRSVIQYKCTNILRQPYFTRELTHMQNSIRITSVRSNISGDIFIGRLLTVGQFPFVRILLGLSYAIIVSLTETRLIQLFSLFSAVFCAGQKQC